jgi:hypothetical protein
MIDVQVMHTELITDIECVMRVFMLIFVTEP